MGSEKGLNTQGRRNGLEISFKFTPYFCNNQQRLGDSVFSPDKRSMDVERASFAHGCANRSEKGLNTLASRRRTGQA